MKIEIIDGLPFVELALTFRKQQLKIERALLDSGSVGTVLKLDLVAEIGLTPEPDDPVRRIVGVGGSEFTFVKMVDVLEVGDLRAHQVQVEIGNMDYGVGLDAIVGTNFLVSTGAVIDFNQLRMVDGRLE